MLNKVETVSFPHYLVVNQFDVDGFEWISKILMFVDEWNVIYYFKFHKTLISKYPKYFMYKC